MQRVPKGRNASNLAQLLACVGGPLVLSGRVSTAVEPGARTTTWRGMNDFPISVDHLRSGSLDRLREIAPELVHLMLLPYLGFDEAKRWAESTAPQA